MTEVYLITPISNGPLSFSGTHIIYYLNCWAIYLLFRGRYPALLPVGDEEELIRRENTLLWGSPLPLMSHPAPAGTSRIPNVVSAKKCLSASESRGLEPGLRGRASPQVPHRKKLSVAEISTAITTKSTNSLNN